MHAGETAADAFSDSGGAGRGVVRVGHRRSWEFLVRTLGQAAERERVRAVVQAWAPIHAVRKRGGGGSNSAGGEDALGRGGGEYMTAAVTGGDGAQVGGSGGGGGGGRPREASCDAK
jgi:hypothetical protein